MKRMLTAVHDAPVLRSPKPGAAPRVEIARVSTPVAFDWVDAYLFDRDEYLPVPGPRGEPIRPWTRDGVAWHPIFHVDDAGRPTARPVHPDELEEWLSGEADPDAEHAIPLARAFAGSPLAPRPLPSPAGKGARGGARVPAFDPGDGSGLLADDRYACAAEVRRIVSEEIVVAEGTVLARFRPMLRYLADGKGAREELVLTPEASLDEPVLGVSRRPFANTLMRGRRVAFSEGISRMFREGRGGCVLDADGDEDLRVMVNLLPGAIRIGMARAVAGVQQLPPLHTVEAVRSADATVAGLERRGAFGLIRADEIPAVLETLRAAARIVSQVADRGIPLARYRTFNRAHEYVLDAFQRRCPDHAEAADADALGSLAL